MISEVVVIEQMRMIVEKVKTVVLVVGEKMIVMPKMSTLVKMMLFTIYQTPCQLVTLVSS